MDEPVVSTRRRTFLQRSVASGVALAANIGIARESAATDRDLEVMRELVAFTRKSFATPFPVPFGSIVVRTGNGAPVARRVNQVGALQDPTAHAEMQTIRAACKDLANMSLAGCTL